MRQRIVTIVFLFVVGLDLVRAQEKSMEAAKQLRESFTKAIYGDFILTTDAVVKDKNGVDYWLVSLKPKRGGLYAIQYNYQSRDGERVKAEYQISVGAAGERRYLDYSNSRLIKQSCYDVAVGDEIVLPVRLAHDASGQTFSNESANAKVRFFDTESYPYYQKFIKSDLLPVPSSIDELKSIGIKSIMAAHRGFSETTVKHYILFEATKPGKFNLMINDSMSIPVIILPRKQAIKSLAGYAHYTTSNPSGTASSAISKTYLLERAVLRPGDVLIVCYRDQVVDRNKEQDAGGPVKVGREAFRTEETGYDYWLGD